MNKLRRSGEALSPVHCKSSCAWWSVINNKNSYLYSDVVSSVGQVNPFGQSTAGLVMHGGVVINKNSYLYSDVVSSVGQVNPFDWSTAGLVMHGGVWSTTRTVTWTVTK